MLLTREFNFRQCFGLGNKRRRVLRPLFFFVAILGVVMIFSAVGQAQGQGKDSRQEIEELTQLSLEGKSGAMNELGVKLAEGDGVKPDQVQAVIWFRRSAELGNADGAGNVGLHYYRGQGVPRNRLQAAKWFFICHLLDGLRCFPPDFIRLLKLSKKEQRRAFNSAIRWLRARPDLNNNHDERPWFGENGKPPISPK